MILFEDDNTPPLRACWAMEGQQARVPITGDEDSAVSGQGLSAQGQSKSSPGQGAWD